MYSKCKISQEVVVNGLPTVKITYPSGLVEIKGFAVYLLESRLDRLLEPNEAPFYKDGNRLNCKASNIGLQTINRYLICPVCGKKVPMPFETYMERLSYESIHTDFDPLLCSKACYRTLKKSPKSYRHLRINDYVKKEIVKS